MWKRIMSVNMCIFGTNHFVSFNISFIKSCNDPKGYRTAHAAVNSNHLQGRNYWIIEYQPNLLKEWNVVCRVWNQLTNCEYEQYLNSSKIRNLRIKKLNNSLNALHIVFFILRSESQWLWQTIRYLLMCFGEVFLKTKRTKWCTFFKQGQVKQSQLWWKCMQINLTE